MLRKCLSTETEQQTLQKLLVPRVLLNICVVTFNKQLSWILKKYFDGQILLVISVIVLNAFWHCVVWMFLVWGGSSGSPWDERFQGWKPRLCRDNLCGKRLLYSKTGSDIVNQIYFRKFCPLLVTFIQHSSCRAHNLRVFPNEVSQLLDLFPGLFRTSW